MKDFKTYINTLLQTLLDLIQFCSLKLILLDAFPITSCHVKLLCTLHLYTKLEDYLETNKFLHQSSTESLTGTYYEF